MGTLRIKSTDLESVLTTSFLGAMTQGIVGIEEGQQPHLELVSQYHYLVCAWGEKRGALRGPPRMVVRTGETCTQKPVLVKVM